MTCNEKGTTMTRLRKSVVTGGAGFIGSHLCEALLAEGNAVTCVDNFVTGRWTNIAHLRDHERFTLLRGDVRELRSVEADEIFCLASPASPKMYQAMPAFTLETIVAGALNALSNARLFGARVLLASTSEVYGDPLVAPQHEGYTGNVNPVGPRACYDEAKRCAETAFAVWGRSYAMKTRIARIFNTYGPRMDPTDGRVIPNFVTSAIEEGALTVYGDGAQTRSLCYVDDTVRGLIALMRSDDPRVDGSPVNIGNPHEITINFLAERILRETGSNSPVQHVDGLPEDPRRRRPDIARAEVILNWRPFVGLNEGLTRTVDWYRGVRRDQYLERVDGL